MEVKVRVYGPCCGQFYGYLTVDGNEVNGGWLGNCPKDILDDVREEYPMAHVTMEIM